VSDPTSVGPTVAKLVGTSVARPTVYWISSYETTEFSGEPQTRMRRAHGGLITRLVRVVLVGAAVDLDDLEGRGGRHIRTVVLQEVLEVARGGKLALERGHEERVLR
jgi:hypothetical protein